MDKEREWREWEDRKKKGVLNHVLLRISTRVQVCNCHLVRPNNNFYKEEVCH